MAIYVTESKREFKPVPAGTHLAVCTQVIDLGVQPGGRYDPKRQVYLRWELPETRITWKDKAGKEHEGPMSIGTFYTLSLNEKAKLRQNLETWRGKLFTDAEIRKFDISVFLGKACMLSIVHKETNGDVFAKVASVLAAPSAVRLKAEGPLLEYSTDEPDEEVFDMLPRWMQERISTRLVLPKSEPVKQGPDPQLSSDEEFDDQIPL